MKTLLIAFVLIFGAGMNEEELVVKTQNETVSVKFESKNEGWATLQIKDATGELALEQQMVAMAGANSVPVFFASKLKKGTYTFVLKIDDKAYTSKFVKE